MVLHKERPGKKSTEIVLDNLVLNPICHYHFFFGKRTWQEERTTKFDALFIPALNVGFIKIWKKKKKVRTFICGLSLFCTVKKPNRTQSKQIHVIFNGTICLCAASQKCQVREHHNVKHEPLQSCLCTKQWLHQKHGKSFFSRTSPSKYDH